MAEGCRAEAKRYRVEDEGVPTATTKEQASFDHSLANNLLMLLPYTAPLTIHPQMLVAKH